MGIIIDFVLIAIIVLSAILGYKKGLVELGAKLFAGIIALVLTLVLFKPVGNIVIDKTDFDEKLSNVIIEKASDALGKNVPESDNDYIQTATESVTTQLKEQTIPNQAGNISKNIIYVVVAILLFIIIKIVLKIIIGLANLVAELPILKQFNEIGGLAYGIVRGILISGILILLMGTFTKINPTSGITKEIESTYVTKNIYNLVIKI